MLMPGLIAECVDTPEQQKAFADNPELFLKYSKMIESELNVRFKFILNGTKEAEGAKEVICGSTRIDAMLKDILSSPGMK